MGSSIPSVWKVVRLAHFRCSEWLGNVCTFGGDVEQVAFRLEVQQYVPGDAWFLRSFVDLLVMRWQRIHCGAWMFQTYGWAVNSIQHHPRLFPRPLSLFWWHGKFQSSSPEKWIDLNWRYNMLPLLKATHPLQWSGGLTAGIKAVRSRIKCIGRVSKNRLIILLSLRWATTRVSESLLSVNHPL